MSVFSQNTQRPFTLLPGSIEANPKVCAKYSLPVKALNLFKGLEELLVYLCQLLKVAISLGYRYHSLEAEKLYMMIRAL